MYKLIEMMLVDITRWPAACIHGDKSQPERDHVLHGICPSSVPYWHGNVMARM